MCFRTLYNEEKIEMECTGNHNLNDKDNTLRVDKKKKLMVYPQVYRCICTECKQAFSFCKVDGTYIEN